MFNKLKLHNFQKYKTKKIKFSPNITTIWGPTESGKSAIIRSLVWTCLNDPPGTLIRTGSSNVCAKLYVDDVCIKREKTKSKNSYKIDKQEYCSIGQSVPDEVQKILSVSADNFQQQHDAHFWFSCSAGEVSKQLNKIVNLDIIDKTAYKIAEKLRSSRMAKKLTENSLEEATSSKKKLADYANIDKDLCRLETLEKDKEILVTETNVLTDVIRKISSAKDRHEEYNKLIKDSEAILTLGESYKTKEKEHKDLIALIKSIKSYNAVVKMEFPSDEELQKIRERVKNISKSLQILVPLIENIEEVLNTLKILKGRIDEGNNIMLAEMKDRCPLCKQKLQ